MAVRDTFLVTAGSDHHGPDATLPDRLGALSGIDPELRVEIGSIASHVRQSVDGDVPVWRGELRAAARAHLLPGVYSNRIDQKVERARVEARLERYAEPLAALVPGFEWPAEDLDRAWRLLLWNGAHDSVCGCSVDGVARAVDVRYGEALGFVEAVTTDALGSLGAQVSQAGVLRFNPRRSSARACLRSGGASMRNRRRYPKTASSSPGTGDGRGRTAWASDSSTNPTSGTSTTSVRNLVRPSPNPLMSGWEGQMSRSLLNAT
jgi:Alpha mannosidase middle domain